jgi:hypothetical protein
MAEDTKVPRMDGLSNPAESQINHQDCPVETPRVLILQYSLNATIFSNLSLLQNGTQDAQP